MAHRLPAWRLAGAMVLLAGASGCEVERAARTDEEIKASHVAFVNRAIEDRAAMSRTVLARWERELANEAGKAGTFDMLVISGGADYGAFGAGVLKGWGEIPDGPGKRPVFDMVSGVSTGALIAPLAFVGSDESYERAFVTYQNPKKDWFVGRGLMNFLFRRESYVDNKGLREETARQVDCAMLDAITAGAAEDRCLLIGTTNLDQGMLKMWDLTALARNGCADEAVQKRIYDVIMASASIPAAFPPVEIDGDLYADGAVTRNIAYTTDQDSELSAVQMWHKKYPGRQIPPVRIWVIINNQLSTPARSVGAPWPEQVKRALEISSRANTIASLKSLSLAVEAGRYDNVAGVEFRYIAIPDNWRPPVEGLFQKETMQSLAQLGYALGKDLANWKTRVPDPESPTRITPDGEAK